MLIMNLTVNGNTHVHKGDGSIDTLLAELNAQLDKVAILVNNDIVPREKRGTVSLKENDRVEIITMAGGG